MSRAQDARDAAAGWLVAREQPGWTQQDQARLDGWLAVSDLNRVAFLRLEHSWREAERIRSLGSAIMPDGVYSSQGRYRKAKRWAPIAIAASLLLAVGIGLQGDVSWPEFDVVRGQYDTGIGGRKAVRLSDGSRIELNTASNVRTAVGKVAREVWLDHGEVYFEVTHDTSRPFVVHVADRKVTVLGTKFSVRRDGDTISVFVREGRVRVDDLHSHEAVRSTLITGGEIALTKGAATLVTNKSDARIADALAWRDGMLSFDQSPLSEVVAEFNRYNRQQLIVTDAAAAGMRIGGIFPASKPDDFVRLLGDAYGLKIEQTPANIRISN